MSQQQTIKLVFSLIFQVPDHLAHNKAAQKLRETGMEGVYHPMTSNRRLK